MWLSRRFRDSVILKANGKVLRRYKPDKLAPGLYDEDPRVRVVRRSAPAARCAC